MENHKKGKTGPNPAGKNLHTRARGLQKEIGNAPLSVRVGLIEEGKRLTGYGPKTKAQG